MKKLITASFLAATVASPALAAPQKTQTKPVKFSDENGIHLQSDFQVVRQRLDEQDAKITEIEAGNEALAGMYDALPNIIKRSAITGFADLVVGGTGGQNVWLNKEGTETQVVDDNVDLATRIRLNALIPISPGNNDALRVRLNYKNIEKYGNRLGFEGGRQYFDGVSDLGIDKLYYQRALGGNKGAVTIGAIETEFKNINAGSGSYRFSEARTFKEYTAAVSGRPTDGGGFGAYYWLTPNVAFSAAYTTNNSTDIDGNKGLFNNDNNSITGEFLYKNKSDTFRAALGYSYSTLMGESIVNYGTTLAADPFGGAKAVGNNIGLQMGYKVAKDHSFNINAGYTWANTVNTTTTQTANIPQYSLNYTYENAFGRKGDKFGLTVGALPYVASASSGIEANNAVPLAVEAVYSYQINKNIAVQPGVVVYTNSNGFDGSPTTVAAYVKTTYNF